ncbi:Retrovirus-related Pol polyprotein from transposon TNT 1-94 [Araneus ventricosus]|uniref:Retrovirus-related Pol polyprotein from transposon TNT 1-94 n=1 Tax=Araneus ventricosus TaxID=182803 RepID=A0A4Y2LEH9_ARAVE|nr:Retrovirus-related Pol polyprotein from transposon TNT 1-94 [Araneus ventricosus]
MSPNAVGYLKELLERHNMLECNTASTPMALGTKLCIATTPDDKLPYRELIGSLNYLAVCTRPDIAYSMSKLSQYLTCYDKSDWLAAKRVLRYLKKTIDFGLVFELDDKVVYGYSDSDRDDEDGTSAGSPNVLNTFDPSHVLRETGITTADRQWNRVLSLNPFFSEAEAWPLGHPVQAF